MYNKEQHPLKKNKTRQPQKAQLSGKPASPSTVLLFKKEGIQVSLYTLSVLYHVITI